MAEDDNNQIRPEDIAEALGTPSGLSVTFDLVRNQDGNLSATVEGPVPVDVSDIPDSWGAADKVKQKIMEAYRAAGRPVGEELCTVSENVEDPAAKNHRRYTVQFSPVR